MPKVIDLPTATSMDDSDYLLMEESGGGTKKITRANALSRSVVGAGNPAGFTVSNGTLTNVCNITLTKGIWMISAQVVADGGTGNGFASVCISTQSATNQYAWSGGYWAQNVKQGWMSITTTRILNVTASSQTVYLVFYHENGGTRNMTNAGVSSLYAVRVD